MRLRSLALIVTGLLSFFGSMSRAMPGAEERQRYWIFFVDKGPVSQREALLKSGVATQHLSPRALQRRAKVLAAQALVDERDLPVYEPYVRRLRELAVAPVVSSRWLNAVSAALDPAQLAMVRGLPFVKAAQPVAVRLPGPEPLPPEELPRLGKGLEHSLDYGPSYQQNRLMRVPEVHDLGIDGTGVHIGMLDTGFRYQLNEAFQRLRVVAEFDFINSDSVTRNEEGQDAPGQDLHGTETLSVIGGFSPGRLIGPAFGAKYVLAKTEYVPSETAIEEDFWVAGIEWLEAMGADVVSSSLGYLDWYTYQDMDGNTAVTTRAADIAVSKGMVVVNSAGNEGNSAWRYVIAPADGDSVIAVGAVNSSGVLASFSSRGPTADGRIKPDVVAMGVGVYMAGPVHVTDFRLGSGTSFSCPLVSGVVALMLDAHPHLTPMQVLEALRETADRAQAPDNDYGWGLVDAWKALLYHGPAFTPRPRVASAAGEKVEVRMAVAGEPPILSEGVAVLWRREAGGADQLVYMLPTEREHHFAAELPRPGEGDTLFLYFVAQDVGGHVFVHPQGAPQNLFYLLPGDSTLRLIHLPGDSSAPPSPLVPVSFQLRALYPNPFPAGERRYVTIQIELAEPAIVAVGMYDLVGRRVATVVEGRPLPARVHRFTWHGNDDAGRALPSGVYFCRVQAGDRWRVQKVVKAR